VHRHLIARGTPDRLGTRLKGGLIVKLRKRYLPIAAVLGAAVAIVPALAASPSEAKLEVNENCDEPNWPCWTHPGGSPSYAPSVTIANGGVVAFSDELGKAANITWTSTPSGPPTCSPEVPVSPTPAKTGWEGKCTFEQPGTYRFESSTLFNAGPNYTKYEIVVESATAGTTPTTPTTTTPTTATPSTPTTPNEPSHGTPLEGGSKALKLAGSQRGSTVHGSIKVSQAGSGGRLEIGLFTASASLAKAGHPAQVRVGRLVRFPLQAGSVSFSVPLNAKGKATLRRRRRLALTVKITLTPPHGAGVTLTPSVVVHA
jgi:hypothetical protein